MANRVKVTDRAREKFLLVLRETANVSEAARSTDVSNRRWYEERNKGRAPDATADQKQFSDAWDDAVEVAVDRLEREAWRRAVEGWPEAVFYQGEQSGAVIKYSDRMLELLLKGHRSNRFKDRVANEVTGPNGGAIETKVTINWAALTDDELRQAKLIAKKLTGT